MTLRCSGMRSGFIKRPGDIHLVSFFENLCDGVSGHTAAECNVPFAEVQTLKSDNFAILGHDFDPPYNVFTPIGA